MHIPVEICLDRESKPNPFRAEPNTVDKQTATCDVTTHLQNDGKLSARKRLQCVYEVREEGGRHVIAAFSIAKNCVEALRRDDELRIELKTEKRTVMKL